MAEQNPTVIIAHLDDEKLRKSIDSLVGYVDEKFKAMTTSTTNAVNHHPQHSVAVEIVERRDDIALTVVFEPVKCSLFRLTRIC